MPKHPEEDYRVLIKITCIYLYNLVRCTHPCERDDSPDLSVLKKSVIITTDLYSRLAYADECSHA